MTELLLDETLPLPPGTEELFSPDLIELAQEGDEGAIATVYLGLHTLVNRVVGRLEPNASEREEFALAALEHVLVRGIYQRKFTGEGSFLGWAARTAHNATIDQLRRKMRRPTITMGHEAVCAEADRNNTYSSAESVAIEQQSISRISSACMAAGVSEGATQTLLMHYVQQLSINEIAEIRGVAEGTIKSEMSRARASLRKYHDTGKGTRQRWDIFGDESSTPSENE